MENQSFLHIWMRHAMSIRLEWKVVLLILLLLIILYKSFFHSNNSNNSSINQGLLEQKTLAERDTMRYDSPINQGLLEQKNFAERLSRKRAFSIAEATTQFLSCITGSEPEKGSSSKWHLEFKIQLFDCIKLHIPIEPYELDSFKAIEVEYKRFLPMDQAYYSNETNPCLFLTVGIGNSTDAEHEFLKRYPRCKMFGIEISPFNVGDYGTFGKVINSGIGFGGQVETVANYTYMLYKNHNLTLKPFNMILAQDVGSRLLHFAAIDIEGYEYDMLKGFEDFGQYESNGIVICQMDVEVHPQAQDFLRPDFNVFLRNFFMQASSYLPIHAEHYGAGSPSIKMTVINTKNIDCEHAFRFSKYFQIR